MSSVHLLVGRPFLLFRTTHHKLAELEDQFKIASVTMRIVLLLVEEAVTQTLEGSDRLTVLKENEVDAACAKASAWKAKLRSEIASSKGISGALPACMGKKKNPNQKEQFYC